MESSAHDVYLETQVTTATPLRLRLMLIEAALRLARQTSHQWQEGRNEEALESLIRCRAIIGELIAGIQPGSSDLAKQVLNLYAFLFRTLTDVQLSHDEEGLQGAIRVLEEERQTWLELCQLHPEAVTAAPDLTAASAQEELAPARVESSWPTDYGTSRAAQPAVVATGGFSIDA